MATTKARVTDIEWDYPEDYSGTTHATTWNVTVEDDGSDLDEQVMDGLSSITGWCIRGCVITYKPA